MVASTEEYKFVDTFGSNNQNQPEGFGDSSFGEQRQEGFGDTLNENDDKVKSKDNNDLELARKKEREAMMSEANIAKVAYEFNKEAQKN